MQTALNNLVRNVTAEETLFGRQAGHRMAHVVATHTVARPSRAIGGSHSQRPAGMRRQRLQRPPRSITYSRHAVSGGVVAGTCRDTASSELY